MKVIGIRKVDFNAQDTGNRITGYSLYCAYDITKNGSGVGVDKIFLSDKKLADCGYFPEIGDEINVTYNRYGKVDSIFPVGQ